MNNFFLQALQNLKEKNLYRSLTSSNAISNISISRDNKELISFACNDYFSLSQHPQVKQAAIDAIEKYGVGARASRYVTGNNSLYAELESQLAHMKSCDDAIVFASGYSTAIGVLPALVSKGDLIVADRLIHSSLIEGAKLSGAKLRRFLHNDVASCRKILEENRGKFAKCLIVTETVFSMDGDCGRVDELLKLAVAFDGLLISDAAHDLWLSKMVRDEPRNKCGEDVKGGAISNNCYSTLAAGSIDPQSHHLQMGTFSKAVGTLGGYICGNQNMIDYLRNFSKTAIYSTALPPAVLAATIASLKMIEKANLGQNSFGQRVLENAEYFCHLMGLKKPESAIVVMIIGDNKKVVDIANRVAKNGFLISAIRPPTVEVGKARLRITFSAAHQKSQIDDLVQELR